MSEGNNPVKTMGDNVPQVGIGWLKELPTSDKRGNFTGENNSVMELSNYDNKAGNKYATNTVVVASNDGQNAKEKESLAAANGNNSSAVDQNETGEVDDEDDESGEGVTTYSGYVPISQISLDWEPPTSLDNQKKKASPPPKSGPPPNTSSRGQGYSRNTGYNRKPVDGLVYTNVGEKARPTPYIWEIKARKFDKKAKNKLFVGGLTFEATKDFLYDQFEKYGEIDDACIVTEKGTGKSRGFGYVTFAHKHDAEEAIKAIDGLRINGKTLCVEFADDPKASRGPGGGRGYRGGRGSGRGRHYDMDRYCDYRGSDPYYDRGPDPNYDRGPDPYYRRGDDPYYDRPPPPRDYDRPPPPRDYDRPPFREYDRPPPRDYRPFARDYDRPSSRDYYGRAPPRDMGYDRPPPAREYDLPPICDYDRPPPPRDYYDRPPARDPAYDRPPPREYDDYKRPPPSYDNRNPATAPRRPSMTDLDVARLRVDRERLRGEKLTSVDQQRILAREKKKETPPSSPDSSDSEDEKMKPKKRHRVIPKAYMM